MTAIGAQGSALEAGRHLLSLIQAHPWLFSLLAFLAWFAARLYVTTYRGPFSKLPGPKRAHWLIGNGIEVMNLTPKDAHQQWLDSTEGTVKIPRVLGQHYACVTDDLKASQYMWTHPDLFIKPEGGRKILEDALGLGLVAAEGKLHRRQRRVLNPAFGWPQLVPMAPTIFEKAYELQRKVFRTLEEPDMDKGVDHVPGKRKLDVLSFVSQATLDIISLVGFGYDCQALGDEPNELREAYNQTLATVFNITLMSIVQFALGRVAGWIPTERQRISHAVRAKSQEIGMAIVAEKKAQLLASNNGVIEKNSQDLGKDCLSLLIKANMAPDLRDDQRLSDAEVADQCSTILFAGHETTGTALMWTLYHLATNQEVQEKLRRELLDVDANEPSWDELHALPYLDAVVHESLRLDSPVPMSSRVATANAVVPLSKPITLTNGEPLNVHPEDPADAQKITELHLPKGAEVSTPIAYINTSPKIWGHDARIFNPDRFSRADVPSAQTPGVWGNLMTFLAGPRNCIGHRLTVIEMKIVLFVLIRSFRFEIPPSQPKLKKTWLVIQRCIVQGEDKAGPQMPLMVSAVEN